MHTLCSITIHVHYICIITSRESLWIFVYHFLPLVALHRRVSWSSWDRHFEVKITAFLGQFDRKIHGIHIKLTVFPIKNDENITTSGGFSCQTTILIRGLHIKRFDSPRRILMHDPERYGNDSLRTWTHDGSWCRSSFPRFSYCSRTGLKPSPKTRGLLSFHIMELHSHLNHS